MSPVIPLPFQLLELNVISGQDLAQVSRKMRTYAVAWVNPDRKLSTRVDLDSHNNPTWNDKFMFRVDEDFLYRETSAIMIEIYANHWFRDVHVGTVRVIIGNLIPPADHKHHQQHGVQLGMRFVALQVRRRSGRPQGILNIGVALLDASRRSMPLYTQTASAVGYSHLMGENNNKDHKKYNHNSNNKENDKINQNQLLLPWIPKPQLRRTKSDTSSMVGSDLVATRIKVKPSSMVNGSEIDNKTKNKNNKERSKTSSYSPTDGSGFGALTKAKYGSDTSKTTTNGKSNSNIDNPFTKFNGFDLGKLQNGSGGGPRLITESELGPSASEVAAAMMKNKYRVEETESDIMGSWSLESSMEGLQSKLERWRTELSPVYDRSNQSSYVTSSVATGGRGASRYCRRHSDGGGDGVFSCFSSVCGMQCSIVCGRSSVKEKTGHKRSPSMGSLSFL